MPGDESTLERFQTGVCTVPEAVAIEVALEQSSEGVDERFGLEGAICEVIVLTFGESADAVLQVNEEVLVS